MTAHKFTHVLITIIVSAGGGPPTARASEVPTPTATPRPRTLGDIKLKTVAEADDGHRIVISDANLAELAGRGNVTVAGHGASAPVSDAPRKTPSLAVREKWRSKVLRQKREIVDLEQRRLRVAARIDLIEDGRLTPRALAQIQRAEIEIEAVDREIREARAELGRIIREARRHGAEPGWFR
jgi:hypothetical protein